MPGVGLLFAAFVLVLSVGSGIVLYSFIRSERDQRSVTDRATAERMARQDGSDGGSADEGDEIEGNHWG